MPAGWILFSVCGHTLISLARQSLSLVGWLKPLLKVYLLINLLNIIMLPASRSVSGNFSFLRVVVITMPQCQRYPSGSSRFMRRRRAGRDVCHGFVVFPLLLESMRSPGSFCLLLLLLLLFVCVFLFVFFLFSPPPPPPPHLILAFCWGPGGRAGWRWGGGGEACAYSQKETKLALAQPIGVAIRKQALPVAVAAAMASLSSRTRLTLCFSDWSWSSDDRGHASLNGVKDESHLPAKHRRRRLIVRVTHTTCL